MVKNFISVTGLEELEQRLDVIRKSYKFIECHKFQF